MVGSYRIMYVFVRSMVREDDNAPFLVEERLEAHSERRRCWTDMGRHGSSTAHMDRAEQKDEAAALLACLLACLLECLLVEAGREQRGEEERKVALGGNGWMIVFLCPSYPFVPFLPTYLMERTQRREEVRERQKVLGCTAPSD